MNYLNELRWLLDSEWDMDFTPAFIVERDQQEEDLSTQDIVRVEERTGGDYDWTLNEQVQETYRASILVKSSDRTFNGKFISGQDRVYGPFHEDTRSHGHGMTDEVEDILGREIDGGPNFDIIIPDSGWQRVESAYGVWAARMDVDLRRTEYK